jgi:hypothetical protein
MGAILGALIGRHLAHMGGISGRECPWLSGKLPQNPANSPFTPEDVITP